MKAIICKFPIIKTKSDSTAKNITFHLSFETFI